MNRYLLLVAVTVASLVSHSTAQAPSVPQPDSVFLEDLTWMEVRDAIAAGKTTVIIPTGGTEQNGPHMALGKHNFGRRIVEMQIEDAATQIQELRRSSRR